MPAKIDSPLVVAEQNSIAAVVSLRKKQALVVVLSIGLLVAILTQPTKNDPDNSAASMDAKATTVESPKNLFIAEKDHIERMSRTQEFQRIELDELSRVELFAAEPLRLQQPLNDATHRVKAIYGTSRQRAALVGQAIVRRGEPLPDGVKVLDIKQDGIQVGR